MQAESFVVIRTVHIVLGSAGFLLGLAAIIVAKFGVRAFIHRWIGRVYAACMLGMSALSVPLAMQSQNTFLLIIGVLTFAWVAGGWIALRRWRDIRRTAPREYSSKLLRTHLILMGSSYIAAWTAFLVNVKPLGSGVVFWLYAFGPTVLGTILMVRASRRYRPRGAVEHRIKSV